LQRPKRPVQRTGKKLRALVLGKKSPGPEAITINEPNVVLTLLLCDVGDCLPLDWLGNVQALHSFLVAVHVSVRYEGLDDALSIRSKASLANRALGKTSGILKAWPLWNGSC